MIKSALPLRKRPKQDMSEGISVTTSFSASTRTAAALVVDWIPASGS